MLDRLCMTLFSVPTDVQKDEQTGAAPGDFGGNITVAGNKIIMREHVSGVDQSSAGLQRMRYRSGEPPVDYNTLRR